MSATVPPEKGGLNSETLAKMFKAYKVYQTTGIPRCGEEIISSLNSF